MNKIVVGIPCFNCAPQIVRLIDELESCLALANQIDHFFFIDNGSRDGTREVLTKRATASPLKSKMTLIKNHKNYGLGGTQKIAFRLARAESAEFLVVLHGDHQARFQDLEKLLSRAQHYPTEVAVLGSRFSRGSVREGYSRVRTWGNKSLNFIYSLSWFRSIEDLGSGINLFKVSEFPQTWVESWSDYFNFNMDLLLALLQARKKFSFVPIHWYETDQVSNARNFRVGWLALKSLGRFRFRQRLPQAVSDFAFTRQNFRE